MILSSMKNNGSAPPSFETDDERSYFLTTLPIHPLFTKTKDALKTENVSPEKVSARRNRDELHELVLQTLKKTKLCPQMR